MKGIEHCKVFKASMITLKYIYISNHNKSTEYLGSDTLCCFREQSRKYISQKHTLEKLCGGKSSISSGLCLVVSILISLTKWGDLISNPITKLGRVHRLYQCVCIVRNKVIRTGRMNKTGSLEIQDRHLWMAP